MMPSTLMIVYCIAYLIVAYLLFLCAFTRMPHLSHASVLLTFLYLIARKANFLGTTAAHKAAERG
jgi:hypothetical protein